MFCDIFECKPLALVDLMLTFDLFSFLALTFALHHCNLELRSSFTCSLSGWWLSRYLTSVFASVVVDKTSANEDQHVFSHYICEY